MSDAIRFQCVACEKKLKALPAYVGRRVRCSGCRGALVVPGEPFPPQDAALPEWSPTPARPDVASPDAAAEAFTAVVTTHAAYTRQLKRLKVLFPEAKPAFRLKERIHPDGVIYGGVTAALTAHLYAVAVLLLRVIGGFLVFGLSWLLVGVAGGSESVALGCFALVGSIAVLVLGGLAVVFFAAAVPGGLVASLITYVTRRGRCHSSAVAGGWSVASCVGGAVLLYAITAFFLASEGTEGQFSPDLAHGLVLAEAVVSLLIAATTAVLIARGQLATSRFCDPCRRGMEECRAQLIPTGRITQTAEAVRAGQFDLLADELTGLQTLEGNAAGQVHLWHCPRCRAGYADVLVKYTAAWVNPDGKSESYADEWVVASAAVPPSCTSVLKSTVRSVGEKT